MSLFIPNKCIFTDNVQTHMEAQKRAQKASSNVQFISAGTAPLHKQAHSSGGERKACWVQQWRTGGFVAE